MKFHQNEAGAEIGEKLPLRHYHVLVKVTYSDPTDRTAGAETNHYFVEAESEGNAIEAVRAIFCTTENSPDPQFTVKRAAMIENRDTDLAPFARIYKI